MSFGPLRWRHACWWPWQERIESRDPFVGCPTSMLDCWGGFRIPTWQPMTWLFCQIWCSNIVPTYETIICLGSYPHINSTLKSTLALRWYVAMLEPSQLIGALQFFTSKMFLCNLFLICLYWCCKVKLFYIYMWGCVL